MNELFIIKKQHTVQKNYLQLFPYWLQEEKLEYGTKKVLHKHLHQMVIHRFQLLKMVQSMNNSESFHQNTSKQRYLQKNRKCMVDNNYYNSQQEAYYSE